MLGSAAASRAARGRGPRTARRDMASSSTIRAPYKWLVAPARPYASDRPPSASATGCSMNETPLPLTVRVRAPSACRPGAEARGRRRLARRGRARWPPRHASRRPPASSRGRRGRGSPPWFCSDVHLVAVDDDHSGCEPFVGGRLQSLPVLAFLGLAVAGHHALPRPSWPSRRFASAIPRPLAAAHPQRARARLDPGNADVRAPVQPAELRSLSSRSRGTTPRA